MRRNFYLIIKAYLHILADFCRDLYALYEVQRVILPPFLSASLSTSNLKRQAGACSVRMFPCHNT